MTKAPHGSRVAHRAEGPTNCGGRFATLAVIGPIVSRKQNQAGNRISSAQSHNYPRKGLDNHVKHRTFGRKMDGIERTFRFSATVIEYPARARAY